MILLDTSVVLALLKGNDQVVAVLRKLSEDDLALSAVTIAEIELGFAFLTSKANTRQNDVFRAFLAQQSIAIVPVDDAIARQYAHIQAPLLRIGKPLSRFDGLIAATALAYHLPLYTLDADFGRVTGLQLFDKD